MIGPLGFIVSAFTAPFSADKVEAKRVGDKVIKTYTYRRIKAPFAVDRAVIKVAEGIVPPIRNPLKIEVSEPSKLEEGLVTEDVKVNVTLPATGLISAERVKGKIKHGRRRHIPIR